MRRPEVDAPRWIDRSCESAEELVAVDADVATQGVRPADRR